MSPDKYKQLQELEEIYKIASTYADKFYVAQKQDSVKLIFCDDAPELGTTNARCAVSMTVNGFLALADLLTKQAETMRAVANTPKVDPNVVPLPLDTEFHDGTPLIGPDGKMKYNS